MKFYFTWREKVQVEVEAENDKQAWQELYANRVSNERRDIISETSCYMELRRVNNDGSKESTGV